MGKCSHGRQPYVGFICFVFGMKMRRSPPLAPRPPHILSKVRASRRRAHLSVVSIRSTCAYVCEDRRILQKTPATHKQHTKRRAYICVVVLEYIYETSLSHLARYQPNIARTFVVYIQNAHLSLLCILWCLLIRSPLLIYLLDESDDSSVPRSLLGRRS